MARHSRLLQFARDLVDIATARQALGLSSKDEQAVPRTEVGGRHAETFTPEFLSGLCAG